MFEPLGGWLELVFVLELFERRIVEKPHAFIGKAGCAGTKNCHTETGGEKAARKTSLHPQQLDDESSATKHFRTSQSDPASGKYRACPERLRAKLTASRFATSSMRFASLLQLL